MHQRLHSWLKSISLIAPYLYKILEQTNWTVFLSKMSVCMGYIISGISFSIWNWVRFCILTDPVGWNNLPFQFFSSIIIPSLYIICCNYMCRMLVVLEMFLYRFFCIFIFLNIIYTKNVFKSLALITWSTFSVGT